MLAESATRRSSTARISRCSPRIPSCTISTRRRRRRSRAPCSTRCASTTSTTTRTRIAARTRCRRARRSAITTRASAIARFVGVQRRRPPDLHARHDRVAQPRRDGVGTRERRARATRSSSRGSSITRTSSRGSSSRSATGATFTICALTTRRSRRPRRTSRRWSTPKTKVVAFSHVSNALGTINPVAEIVAIARARRRARRVRRRAGARRICRSTSMRSTSTSTRSAATRCSGRWACGVLVGRRALLEAMPPYQIGGDMIEFVARRAHDVERAAAQVRGGHAERRRRGRARRGVRLSRRDRDGRGARARARADARSRRSGCAAIDGRARLRSAAERAQRRGELHAWATSIRTISRRFSTRTASASAPGITARSR